MASGGTTGIRWDDGELVANLQNLDKKVDKFLTASVAYHATRAQAYARQNAPWRDRTANARTGLFARAERDRPKYRIIIAHSVPYGIWLETRWSGRYRIIQPTISHESDELMKTVSLMWSRVL